MRRLLVSATAALALATSAIAHAASQSATTVRGKLTVTCARTGTAVGQYRYALSGKRIAKLGSGCVPGLAETHIAIVKVLPSAGSTAVVVQEGVNAYSDNQRLIFIPKSGPASYIEAITASEDPGVTRTSATAFHLKVPAEGYAIDMDHLSHWTCLIDVDFATGKASGRAATPHEKRLPAGVCKASIVKVPI